MSSWTAEPWRCRRYAALKRRNYLSVDTASSVKENIWVLLEPGTRTVFIIRKGLAINMRESCLIWGLSRPSSPKLRHREAFFLRVLKKAVASEADLGPVFTRGRAHSPSPFLLSWAPTTLFWDSRESVVCDPMTLSTQHIGFVLRTANDKWSK